MTFRVLGDGLPTSTLGGLEFYPKSGFSYDERLLSTESANLLTYWKLNEAAGPTAFDSSGNGYNGVEIGAPVWGQLGIGDGETSVSFDGANDAINAFSTGFRDAWDGDEGTAMIWAKVSGAGVWSDALDRRALLFAASGTNLVAISKESAVDTLEFRRIGSATTDVVLATENTTDWFHLAIAWSLAGDVMTGYLNGVVVDVPQSGLLVWVGLLGAANTVIGANNATPTLAWDGNLAKCAVWDTSLSGSQIANLATV